MPLFRRPDGEYLSKLPTLRRMMPYVMPTRTESAVYFDQWADVTETLAWLDRQNAGLDRKAVSLFHVILAAAVRGLGTRPGLNRFVVGRRIYQRKDVVVSFAVKKRFHDEATMTTVKAHFQPHDTLPDVIRRVDEIVNVGRGDRETTSETEMRWAWLLPRSVIRLAFKVLHWLDYFNLMPAGMIRSDPLYCSLFLANLGSVGIDAAYHHLYEHGTAPLFGVIGRVRKMQVVQEDGRPAVRDMLLMRFTFDERVNDGFYAARSLDVFRQCIEDPEQLLHPPVPHSAEAPGTVARSAAVRVAAE